MCNFSGGVQVHTGSGVTAACESINARAFTVGNHVAFNSAQQVMQGVELGIQRMEATEVHIQRKEGLGSHVRQNTETTYPPTNGQPQAQQGGFDEALSLLTNGGVDLDEESVQEILADLDYTSIMKKRGLAFAKQNAAVKSLLAGVDEAHGQLSGRDPTPEETLQNRLGQVDFPEHWMSDLEAMGPPDGWMRELKKHTESVVQSEIGSDKSRGLSQSTTGGE